ncbi:glycine cleavage system aminomethyltransferase GcvT [Isosphaeraceae bacterium EP7]
MTAETPLQTPLHAWHKAHGGRLVEFGGWSMPVQYTTIVDEHNAVRRHAGLFDIGHMGRLRFRGPDALAWVERLTTNHVAKLSVGQIQYSLMANEAGGLVDDVLVYSMPDGLAMVCNASNRAKVIEQFESSKQGLNAQLIDDTPTTSMIAVQGPAAVGLAQTVFQGADLEALKYYWATDGRVLGQPAVASRTGYTGEDGIELVVPASIAMATWEALIAAGAIPCGLGARDTLRFEAGMPLYGHEMDETVNPYAAGLGWAVKLKKGPFIGRDALVGFKANPGRTRVGLRLDGKRIARQGYEVSDGGRTVGVVTSGSFPPTINASLAMALIEPALSAVGTPLTVNVRGNLETATVIALPFYRRPEA